MASKTGLGAEVKRLATLSRRGELNEEGWGYTDYAPAVRQAAAYLTIKANAEPSAAWYSELHDAHVTRSYPLSSLNENDE